MLEFIKTHIREEILTLVLLFCYFIIRFIITKIIVKFSNKTEKFANRTQVVIKYTNILLALVCLIFLFMIWGVKTDHLALAFSSIFAVIGVAMFAQWSLLSNISAGVIIFFTAPFHIGDIVKIHDKDFPFEAEIIDIKGFHIYLKTEKGELIIYPNNIFFTKSISILNDFSRDQE
ncbi:MAG: mechanosensitive ion channel domain-containing protein [Flavobacterium sp.]|jgi:small-conductance mechanosensitive channel